MYVTSTVASTAYSFGKKPWQQGEVLPTFVFNFIKNQSFSWMPHKYFLLASPIRYLFSKYELLLVNIRKILIVFIRQLPEYIKSSPFIHIHPCLGGFMNSKLGHINRAAQSGKPITIADLPEKIAIDKKRETEDKNRNRRRYFEQQRERRELEDLLHDPYDD